MNTLSVPALVVHTKPESAEAFIARLEAQDAAETARLARDYPVGAALLLRNARRLVVVARSRDGGDATDREYWRAVDDVAYACDEMDPRDDETNNDDDRTEPEPDGTEEDDDGSTVDYPPIEPDDAPDARVTRQPGYWESLEAAGVTRLPVLSGGSPAAEWDLAAAFQPGGPTETDLTEYAEWSAELDDDRDGMAFPRRSESVEERRRLTRQNMRSEAAHAADVE